ncbi:MAG: four helix bundle protein [Acidobacteriota bacterium]|nr:four helix bundle protein [Acidobacteriota bacterium]
MEVYRLTESFPRHELYGLSAQMRRAAVSVVSHISEAEGRLLFGERRQLLSQGRGSLFELEAQLIVAERLGYATNTAALRASTSKTGAMLMGFIRYTQRREAQTKTSRRSPTT